MFGSAAAILMAAAGATAAPLGARGQLLVGPESEVRAARAVARSEPYYAFRNETRTQLQLHLGADYFFAERWSVGATALAAHERATAGSVTRFGLRARVGRLVDAGSYTLWPLFGAGTEVTSTGAGTFNVPSLSAELRVVFPLRGALLSLGPRVEADLGVPAPSRTASLVLGVHAWVDTARSPTPPAGGPTGLARAWLLGLESGALLALRSTASEVLVWPASTLRLRGSIDRVIDDKLTLGGSLAVASTGDEAARVTAVAAGARIGRVLPEREGLWWWPRVALQGAWAQAATTRSPTVALDVAASASAVLRLGASCLLSLGPTLSAPISITTPRPAFTPSIGVESALFVVL